jgi:hypothetical protein
MELNCQWTNDFEKNEKFFNEFYKEPVENLQLSCYYINANKELFHMKKQNLYLDDGLLKKENLIYHIRNNMFYNKRKYTPLSILKYNINLDPEDIKFYLNDKNSNNFLSIERNIDLIKWDETITLFQDLNSLILIYIERVPSQNTTKKVYIKKRRHRKSRRKFT